eukprot:7570066-Prorocentrum_lima.AAC.1
MAEPGVNRINGRLLWLYGVNVEVIRDELTDDFDTLKPGDFEVTIHAPFRFGENHIREAVKVMHKRLWEQ